MRLLRKVWETGLPQIYPPPAHPFAREGRGATMPNNKIYSILSGRGTSLPAGREGLGVGKLFCGVDSLIKQIGCTVRN